MGITLGELVKMMREDRGLSQRELADDLDCSNSSICDIEAGVRHPRSDFFARLEAALGCGPAQLYLTAYYDEEGGAE